jgi:hypothetical protein
LSNGYAAEALFDYLATDKGLTVSRPLAHARYDRIVDHNGKLSRVQIKMTANKRGNRYWVKTCWNNKHMYKDTIDYIAIYIKPECAWFIIPSCEIKGTAMTITMAGKASVYINNWKVFYEEKD